MTRVCLLAVAVFAAAAASADCGRADEGGGIDPLQKMCQTEQDLTNNGKILRGHFRNVPKAAGAPSPRTMEVALQIAGAQRTLERELFEMEAQAAQLAASAKATCDDAEEAKRQVQTIKVCTTRTLQRQAAITAHAAALSKADLRLDGLDERNGGVKSALGALKKDAWKLDRWLSGQDEFSIQDLWPNSSPGGFPWPIP